VSNAVFKIEKPKNEPVLSYAPGTKERKELKARLVELRNQEIEIPLIIGGKKVRTGKLGKCIIPHNKETVIGRYHMAGEDEVAQAIEAALSARSE